MGNCVIENITNSSTSFAMPNSDVSIKAIYGDVYLTVGQLGTGSGYRMAGQEVELVAEESYTDDGNCNINSFTSWAVPNGVQITSLGGITNNTIRIIMPGENITINPLYNITGNTGGWTPPPDDCPSCGDSDP